MIYLIGGVSRAGKSSVRRHLLKYHGISGLETDSLRTTLEIATPELNIHHRNDPYINATRMQPYIKAFIESRLFFKEDFVVEGDCITPEIALMFAGNEKIKAVFMGYPTIAPDKKFDQLSQNLEGWTATISSQELEKKIKMFIDSSAILEEVCSKYNLPFINTSSHTLQTVIETCLQEFGSVGAGRGDVPPSGSLSP